MMTDAQLVDRLKTTGLTAGYVMQAMGVGHIKARAILIRLGAQKSNTAVPTLWRMPGTAVNTNWVRGPGATVC